MGRRPTDIEGLFEEVEERQSCLVSTDERMAQLLRRRVALGEAVLLAPRIYARKSYWEGLNQTARGIHLLRALSERSPDIVFSHTSAAIAYGLQVPWKLVMPFHCAVPRVSHSPGTSLLVRHPQRVIDQIMFEDIHVTTPERTIVDCLRTLDLPEGLAVADSAIATGLLTQDAMREALCAHELLPGFEHAMQTVELADGRAANGGESHARAVMLELGCMPPDLQHRIVDPITGEVFYSDFFWRRADDTTVVGELDGYDKYYDESMTGGKTIDEVLLEERIRESRITAQVDGVMRFRFSDVLDSVGFAKLLGEFDVPMGHDPPLVLPHPQLGCGMGSGERGTRTL